MGWTVVSELIRTVGLGLVVPLLVAWIGTKVKNAEMRQAIDMAARRAGGIAAEYADAVAKGVDPQSAREAALVSGVQYLKEAVPDYLQAFGVGGSKVAEMVIAERNRVIPPTNVEKTNG